MLDTDILKLIHTIREAAHIIDTSRRYINDCGVHDAHISLARISLDDAYNILKKASDEFYFGHESNQVSA